MMIRKLTAVLVALLILLSTAVVQASAAGEKKFFFTDNQGWGTVYVHSWKTSGAITTWPGTKVTEKTVNGYGETVFTITVPSGATGLVINSGEGGSQTVDITNFDVKGYYTKDKDMDSKGHYYVYSWESGSSGGDGGSTTVDENATVSNNSNDNATILQAWNWSYSNITKELSRIASQGFSVIQISPPNEIKKETSGHKVNGEKKNGWWMFYQPAGFQINNSSGNALGTKAELIAMINAAHKKGIRVIADAVVNHMGTCEDEDGMTSENPMDHLTPAAYKFEPEICNNKLFHDPWFNMTYKEDASKYDQYTSTYDLTRGCTSRLPDLKTEDSRVQSAICDYLKELIDAGIDGFRFDAAKHIETDKDCSGLASNFWKNTVSVAKDYAKTKYGKDILSYGEILNTCGVGRSYDHYYPYMKVTDSGIFWQLSSAVDEGKADAAVPMGMQNGSKQNTVLWDESHDTFVDGSTTGFSYEKRNKLWALIASRDGVTSLYFARPADTVGELSGITLGEARETAWANSPAVAAVNKFNNAYVGKGEYLGNESGIAIIGRGSKTDKGGAVLVNMSGTGRSISGITLNTVADGKYKDEVSGNEFTVSGGKASGSIGGTGVAVIYPESVKPTQPSTAASTAPSTAASTAASTSASSTAPTTAETTASTTATEPSESTLPSTEPSTGKQAPTWPTAPVPTKAPTAPATTEPTEAVTETGTASEPTEAATAKPSEGFTDEPTDNTEPSTSTLPTDNPSQEGVTQPTASAPTEPEQPTDAPTEGAVDPTTPGVTEPSEENPTEPSVTQPATEAQTDPAESQPATDAMTDPTEPETQPVTDAQTEPETQTVTDAPTEPETQPATEAPTKPAVTQPATQAPAEKPTSPGKDISSWKVMYLKNKTYTGKPITQNIFVTDGYDIATIDISYINNTNAGTAVMTINGTGNYTGSLTKTFEIKKAANTAKVTVKTKVKAKAAKKTNIKEAVLVSDARGKVTVKTNNKKVTVKNGVLTVAKGLKKGKTISVKVTVTVKGNGNYKAKKIVKTIKIKVV